MSWFDGVPASLLYAGPPQNYPAAAAAATTAQSLVAGASGGYSQPVVPFGFWQMGKNGQVLIGHLGGVLTGQATATTAIFTIGLATAANSVAGTSLVASPAATVTSQTGVGWEIDFKIVNRGTGYGVAGSSTSLMTSMITSFGGTVSPLQQVIAPTTVATIDASANQWLYATVTFSTASASNNAQLQSAILYGMS